MLEEILKAACGSRAEITPEKVEKFRSLTEYMTGAELNVTAITDGIGIALKHYADSLSLLSSGLIESGVKMCDVGCGGGFPGLPLKIVVPDISINMIDSTAKKIEYVKGAAAALGLEGLTFTAARAEDLARPEGGCREIYDLAAARAVARLNVLCELCLPFVRVGGHFIAMKGAKAPEELREAQKAISALGGGGVRVEQPRFDLDSDDPAIAEFRESKRYLVIIEKVRPCPDKYPRPYARISKSPIS